MKYFFVFVLLTFFSCSINAKGQHKEKEVKVEIKTSEGIIVLKLFNDTPIHRDNFIKKIKEGVYNGKSFNRVVPDFMIQCGEEQDADIIPAEIHYPITFHKRGMVGMGRCTGDPNHELKSADEQFYIVWGKTYTAEELDKFNERIKQYSYGRATMTPELKEYYQKHPGSPWIDGSFTLFGHVVKGLKVVKRIQSKMTNPRTQSPLERVGIDYIKVKE